MNNLDLLEIAQREFRDAIRWYRHDNLDAARRFAIEVKSAVSAIQANPTRYSRWDDRYRFFLLRKFPYYVAYRIEPDSIVLVAVFHTSRDASAWTDR